MEIIKIMSKQLKKIQIIITFQIQSFMIKTKHPQQIIFL